jgi:hypothetical protein
MSKRSNPFGRTKEEQIVLGALTRLAIFFQTSRETFTGEQVAEIILMSWHSYEASKGAERGEVLLTTNDQQPTTEA